MSEFQKRYTVRSPWGSLSFDTEESQDSMIEFLESVSEAHKKEVNTLKEQIERLRLVAGDFVVALSGLDHNDIASFSKQSSAEEWAEWVCKKWEGITATLTVKDNPRLNKRYRNGKWEAI